MTDQDEQVPDAPPEDQKDPAGGNPPPDDTVDTSVPLEDRSSMTGHETKKGSTGENATKPETESHPELASGSELELDAPPALEPENEHSPNPIPESDPSTEPAKEDPDHATPSSPEAEASPEEAGQESTSGEAPPPNDRAALPSIQDLENRLAMTLGITKPRDRFMFDTAFNFLLVMVVVLPVDLIFQYYTQESTSLMPFQEFLAWAVKGALAVFGVRTLNIYTSAEGSPTVSVPEITDWEITAQCTGLHETLFLALLVLLFRGVRPRVRIKWAGLFAIIIFFENMARILVGYPMEKAWGFDAWDRFHFYWWHYGQYLFIMTLFIIWVNTVAYKDILDQKRERKRLAKKAQTD